MNKEPEGIVTDTIYTEAPDHAANADTGMPHYGAGDLVARVEAALQLAGLGEGVIPWDALAPLDQFHVGGAAATTALAARLRIGPGARLLDIGCGLGGPARHLASVHGCLVTGIDLSRPFIGLAAMLTERTRLSRQVRYRVGDATRFPAEPEGFDLAWMQHVAMNIADRRGLYSAIRAVLRPGGRLAIYDVIAGEGGPLQFPVPWARDPVDSFLASAEATREALGAAGFAILDWADVTDAGLKWIEAQATAGRNRPDYLQALALPLVMGPDFPVMAANLGLNLRERRVRLLQAVAERPS